MSNQEAAAAADALERWEKATGGLNPALVTKALTRAQREVTARQPSKVRYTNDEVAALRAATFETPT